MALLLILSIFCGHSFTQKSVNNGFYVVFPVKHIFNQAVDVSEHIDFTPYLHVSCDGDR